MASDYEAVAAVVPFTAEYGDLFVRGGIDNTS